ncbi:hypothetical protein ANCCAN_05243 [Ancylostoma caninum]|uniref:Uncharacterized protein n=1 Tax=Ancylostoma caninum TaxID=29170 RepID=A0A368GZZ8_ANCCA|nr:hypothetical protein ANCCAN_05243 [Ancylostoma caninum]
MKPFLLLIFLAFINSGQACQSKVEAPVEVESTPDPKADQDSKSNITSTSEQTVPLTTSSSAGGSKEHTSPSLHETPPSIPSPKPKSTLPPRIVSVKTKRAAEIAKMTVVTYVNHARLDVNYQELFQSSIERFAETIGYNKDDFALENIKDEDGKITISYNVHGVACEKLNDLAQKFMDHHTMDEIISISTSCGDMTENETN